MVEMNMTKAGVAIIDHVGLKAGMECYDLELFSALRKAGYTPYVFSNFAGQEKEIRPVFSFRVKENLFSFIKLLRTYDKIVAEISAKQISYCILHGFRFGFWEWFMMRKLKKSSAKILLIVHDIESLVGNSTSAKWRSKIFDMSSRIVVHNKFSFEELSKELIGNEKDKLAVIPHGNFIGSAVQQTNTAEFLKRHDLSTGRKRLLFFGQIKETKGLDLLLEAFALTEPATDLIIAGRLRKQSFLQYQVLIDKHKLGGRVKLFIGYISPAMRNELFQVADAVVLPYKRVFQSGVMLMAMSYGKAVIASDLAPNMEIITSGQNGFLFESGNKKELARVIDDVMKKDDTRKEAGRCGMLFVRQKHDWDSIALQWIKLFES